MTTCRFSFLKAKADKKESEIKWPSHGPGEHVATIGSKVRTQYPYHSCAPSALLLNITESGSPSFSVSDQRRRSASPPQFFSFWARSSPKIAPSMSSTRSIRVPSCVMSSLRSSIALAISLLPLQSILSAWERPFVFVVLLEGLMVGIEHHEAMKTCHHLPVDSVLDVATCSTVSPTSFNSDSSLAGRTHCSP